VPLNTSSRFTPEVVLLSGERRWLDLDFCRGSGQILVVPDNLLEPTGDKHNEWL